MQHAITVLNAIHNWLRSKHLRFTAWFNVHVLQKIASLSVERSTRRESAWLDRSRISRYQLVNNAARDMSNVRTEHTRGTVARIRQLCVRYARAWLTSRRQGESLGATWLESRSRRGSSETVRGRSAIRSHAGWRIRAASRRIVPRNSRCGSRPPCRFYDDEERWHARSIAKAPDVARRRGRDSSTRTIDSFEIISLSLFLSSLSLASFHGKRCVLRDRGLVELLCASSLETTRHALRWARINAWRDLVESRRPVRGVSHECDIPSGSSRSPRVRRRVGKLPTSQGLPIETRGVTRRGWTAHVNLLCPPVCLSLSTARVGNFTG